MIPAPLKNGHLGEASLTSSSFSTPSFHLVHSSRTVPPQRIDIMKRVEERRRGLPRDLEHRPKPRAASVAASCGVDTSLRREVESLLTTDVAVALVDQPAMAFCEPHGVRPIRLEAQDHPAQAADTNPESSPCPCVCRMPGRRPPLAGIPPFHWDETPWRPSEILCIGLAHRAGRAADRTSR